MPYRILPHPADIGLRAEGTDLPAALDQAVAALAEIQAGAAVAGEEERPVHLDSDDVESLVVDLLEECLYHVDAHDWLAAGARLVVREDADGTHAEGVLRGAAVPGGGGMHVKAITWHQLSVERVEAGAVVTVYLDI